MKANVLLAIGFSPLVAGMLCVGLAGVAGCACGRVCVAQRCCRSAGEVRSHEGAGRDVPVRPEELFAPLHLGMTLDEVYERYPGFIAMGLMTDAGQLNSEGGRITLPKGLVVRFAVDSDERIFQLETTDYRIRWMGRYGAGTLYSTVVARFPDAIHYGGAMYGYLVEVGPDVWLDFGPTDEPQPDDQAVGVQLRAR